MSTVLLNISLILVFIAIGGVFAAAEMALVSLRDSQIRQLAHRGKRGQTVARLTENPNRFLSAVQIGVTLAGFLSAAFGGVDARPPTSRPCCSGWGCRRRLADTIALVLDHHRDRLRLDRARRADRQTAGPAADREASR